MQTCKCEHWQQCPICMPDRFDADGRLKPPEPTPLQACRHELEKHVAALRRLALELENHVAAGRRLALELECLLMDTKDMVVVSKWWDSAHEALATWQALDQQPHISPLGMD